MYQFKTIKKYYLKVLLKLPYKEKIISPENTEKLLIILKEYGKKADLARFLHVTPTRISQLCASKRFPSKAADFIKQEEKKIEDAKKELERKEKTRSLLNKLINMIDEMKKHIDEFLKKLN